MFRMITLAAILAIGIFAILGCSQSSPVGVPTQPAFDRTSDWDDHALWGYYRFYLDPAGPTVEVEPLRQVAKHWNVKSFVLPPNCPDCVKVKPTGPYKNNILPITVTLKNPQQIAGYDVRGILISNDEGAYLANPDNYTDLFDDGGPITINPFKAYATIVPNRKFGPGESHEAAFTIYLEKFNKVAIIDYAIDANWPGRAKEPYLISYPFLKRISEWISKPLRMMSTRC